MRLLPCLLLLPLSSLPFLGCDGSAGVDDDSAGDDDAASSQTLVDEVPSALRSAPMEVGIYLPPGYDDATEPWPVVYLLHGDGGDAEFWFEDQSGEGTTMPEVADAAIASGAMPGAVIVTPNGSFDPQELPGDWTTMDYFKPGAWYSDSELTGPYESIIIGEVMPFIEANYNVTRDAAHRGLIGHSMGGYGTLRYAMHYGSSLWAAACAMSPMADEYVLTLSGPSVAAENEGLSIPVPGEGKSFTNLYYTFAAAWSPNPDFAPWYIDHVVNWSEESLPIIQTVFDRWLVHDPVTMLADPTYLQNLQSIPLRLDVGDHDEYYFHLMVNNFDIALTDAGVEHETVVFEGTHSNKLFTRLADNLPWIVNQL